MTLTSLNPAAWPVRAAVLAGLLAVSPAGAGETEQRPNIATPTLGGKQVWRDGYVHAGWRIQENIMTGHHRLLDPENIRRAWGSFNACRERFETIRDERAIRPRSRHMVLLIHGIARSTGTFSEMAPALRSIGYDAIAISYPSTRGTIEEHADGIARLLGRLEGTEKVSFVTHSMGGIVLRHLLAMDRPWEARMEVGRVVMIAPPNQGSAVARFLEDVPLYQALYGTPGQQLVPRSVTEMRGLDGRDFAIIAGGRGDGKGFNPLLSGDDDGTVTVDETHLPGARAHLVIPALHGVISNRPETIQAVSAYLGVGSFEEKRDASNDNHQ